MTTGIALVRRWFNQGHSLRPPECVERVRTQSKGIPRGCGFGPEVNHDDMARTVLAMLRVTQKPTGHVIVVDARGFKAPPPGAQQARWHRLLGFKAPLLADLLHGTEGPGRRWPTNQ